MSGSLPYFPRIAALAEVLFVLALGNIAGVLIFEAIVPASATSAEAGGVTEALYAGLRIFLRIGLIAVFGLTLLWFRRGLSPRDAGLTRAGQPLSHLVGIGFVLGLFSSFLVGSVFAVHAIVPLGEGLTAWATIRESELDLAFYVDLLATSIIIPPLVEEIMARGYTRLRMVESYGRIGGVILTGLIFALAHGKFISADPLLAVSLVLFVISSISWTYIAQTTGSLIPPMIAHAMTNGIATAILFNVWMPFATVTLLLLWQRRPIFTALRHFANDWRMDEEKAGLWFGIVVLVVGIAATMIVMSLFGRVSGLIALGTVGLLITVANILREKRS